MIRWYLCPLVGFAIFANHFTRDSVGALEKQIEDNGILTVSSYNNMNTLFFLPNIVTPLLAGVGVQRLGGAAKGFFYSNCIAFLGHLTFSLGSQVH